MKSGIYIITCLINNKVYIGRAKNWKNRIGQHKKDLESKRHPNYHLQNAYNKYGKENFNFELLEEYLNEEFILPSMENYWCNILQAHNPKFGYNIAPTNPYAKVNPSKETREKISKANIGKKRTEEQNKIMSEKRKGKKLSEQHKINLGKSLKGKTKGRKISKEHFDKLQLGNKNRIISEELRKKYSEGVKNRLTFKEDMEKLHKTKLIPIIQLDLNDNFIKKWESAAEVERILKIFATSITSLVNGKSKSKTAGGFKWMKLKDYNL